MTETYKNSSPQILSFNLQSFNLQKFNFYADIIKESEDKNLALTLLDAMINFVSSEGFYWDITLSEPYLTTLEDIGFLLSLQDEAFQKTKEIINTFKINHQGWNPAKIDYKPLVKESFIYSSVACCFRYDSVFNKESDKKIFSKSY